MPGSAVHESRRGHGDKTWLRALSSIGTAFAFTIAYALTRSLWWPMLIHSFMGLYGAWSGYRLNRNAVA
ncbi:MAG TPA: CPBP family intramembrane glutamic endopeptidase [Rhizomicrobium sp.]